MKTDQETRPDMIEAQSATQKEFRDLVLDLIRTGQTVYDYEGNPICIETEYLLPDGRTMSARKLVDKSYDEGVELGFSETAISQDGQPYEINHSYVVYDYGATHQFIYPVDDISVRRQNYHGMLPSLDEERQAEYEESLIEERAVGLDSESLERQWDMQGMAQAGGVQDIYDSELQDVVRRVSNLQKEGKLEALPAKDLPSQQAQPEEAPEASESHPPILGAVATKDSSEYNAELATTEPANPETIKQLEQLAISMSQGGKVMEESLDYFEVPQPSYEVRHYDLVDDSTAEIRVYTQSHGYQPKILIKITDPDRDNIVDEQYSVEKWYYVNQDGGLMTDIRPADELARQREEFEQNRIPTFYASNEDLESQAEREAELGMDGEGLEQEHEGLTMGVEFGLHDVTQSELKRLMGLLKTAEAQTEA